MRTAAKILLSSLLALAAWAGVLAMASAAGYRVRFGAVYTESQAYIVVSPGDRFSILLPDKGASVGDSWSATILTPGVVEFTGKHLEPDGFGLRLPFAEQPVGGGGGTRYFTFTAVRAGQTEIRFVNCFQGCHEKFPEQPANRTVDWSVRVR